MRKRKQKKTSRLLPIITKVNNKYYYSRTVRKHLPPLHPTLTASPSPASPPPSSPPPASLPPSHAPQLIPYYPLFTQIPTHKQSDILTPPASPSITTILTPSKPDFSKPFLILDAKMPIITMPEVLDVAMHEGKAIDYSGEVLFHRISTDSFFDSFRIKLEEGEIKHTKGLMMSVPQMQLKPQQYQIPRMVAQTMPELYHVNLWLYAGERLADWHYDGHDNFLYMLEGIKVVYLAHPVAIKSNSVFTVFNNHSNPMIVEGNVIKCTLDAGKCLYIPKGWWHRVESYGWPSKAVNFWGNSVTGILKKLTSVEKTLILKEIMFEITEKFSKQLWQNWENMPEPMRQKIRRATWQRLLDQQRWELFLRP